MAIVIMHILDNLGIGGLQNGLSNLLGSLDSGEFRHVLCPMRAVRDCDLQPLPRAGVDLICLNGRHRSPVQIHQLARLIRRVRPDIVHSRNWSAIEAVLAARSSGCRAVIHGEHGFDSGPETKEPIRRNLFRRLSFEAASRVVTVSEQLRSLHASNTGFAAERITVIHNGVDCNRFNANPLLRRNIRKELGFSEQDICFGCVGNVTPVKDHKTLFRAVQLLDSRHKHWRILLAGDGPGLADLRDFVARQSLSDRVHFVGRSKRVRELLTAMDVYVLPSLSEGICNALLEAMATGLPVVATDTGGNPEVVINESCGLLFPVGDIRSLEGHLSRLYLDPNLRRQFGRAAMARVSEHFSLNSMVLQYEDLYKGVLNLSHEKRSIAAQT